MELVKTTLGNLLEWFDFALFLYLAPTIGATFFPTHDLESSTLTALAVFTIGYLCRPFGGIIFGSFGDRKGRSPSLKTSILLMSMTTLGIGLTPSYAQIGITAPILFIVFRMLQGVSAGGEYCGVMIYLAESSSLSRRGFITSLAGSGSNLGFLLATLSILLLKTYFTNSFINDYAWRALFIILGLFGGFVFYLRLNLHETKAYDYLQQHHAIDQKPLLAAIVNAPFSLLKIFGLTCLSSIFYIVLFGIMPTYLSEYEHLPLTQTLAWQSILLVMMIILIPFGGWLGDHIGRKNMLYCTTSIVILGVFPAFYLLNSQNTHAITAVLGIATIISSLDQGNNLAAFVENCPVDVRFSGIGFAFNVGNALFGGTAPLLFTLIAAHYGRLAPAYYLMAAAFVTLVTVSTLLNKSQISDIGFLSR